MPFLKERKRQTKVLHKYMFIMDFLNHDFVHWCWFTCVERLKNHLSTVLLLNAGMSIGMQNRCQSEGVEMLKNPDLYN